MKITFRLIVVSTSLILASACSANKKHYLDFRPEQAFDDPKQVALARAAEQGDLNAIAKLVEQGADVNADGKQHMTALWYAFTAAEKKAFEFLLKLGANPNTPSLTGGYWIEYCAMVDDSDYLRLALAHGANPNLVNSRIKQPLIFRAIGSDEIAKLELLIGAGADINIRHGDGSTPVIYAALTRQMRTVLFLLQRGADPELRDKLNMDIADGIFGPNWDTRSDGYKARAEVIKLLEDRGYIFDWSVIEAFDIRNLGEATGKEPPKWLKTKTYKRELNPEWVKLNPEEAERMRRESIPPALRNRPTPRLSD